MNNRFALGETFLCSYRVIDLLEAPQASDSRVKKHFQHLQELLGAKRRLPLQSALSRRLLIFAAGGVVITALLSAQSPESAPTPPAEAPQIAAPAASAPALPEPPLPPPRDAAPPAPTPPPNPPSPPEETVLLEEQPLTNQTPQSSSPFAAPPPQPTPPLRAADVAFPAATSRAQNEPLVAIGRPVTRTDYGDEGNRKAAQLRSMPPERLTFDRALLRDVLRFLAETAGVPFIGIPENSPQASQLVTFRMTASPFAALESVCRQNEIKIVYEDGVWFLRVGGDNSVSAIRELESSNELVGVIYQLRHDPADHVEFRGQGGGGQQQSQFQGQGSQNSANSMGGASITTPNLPLQNSQKVFVHLAPKIVNDVRAILGLRPLVYKDDGSVEDPDITGGTDVPISSSPLPATGSTTGVDNSATASSRERSASGEPAKGLVDLFKDEARVGRGLSTVYVPANKPQVIYNSDSNFLWVVATRKQHKWVAEYLSKVDKKQELIAIEVKFLETKKNPQVDIGINWQNTFGTGLTLTGGASIGGQNIGSFGYTNGFNNQRTDQRQIGVGQAENLIFTNSNGSVSTYTEPGSPPFSNSIINDVTTTAQIASASVPYSAVLSLDQFSVTLQAFMQDRDTSIVQYPRVLTVNNKEVAITSADNTPLNVGTSTSVSATGTSGTTVGQLGYLPTGTQINILPKVVNSSQIAMTVAITVSSVVGELPINLGTGVNLYPVTSQRVYNASLQVDSGNTLAVGGLEKVDDSNVAGGVPVLKDIPGLGYLFKNKNKRRNKVNLIIFITPYLIGDPAKTPGISESPKSVVPQRPGLPPPAPTFTAEGKLAGGEVAVIQAFDWLEFQLRYFRQVNFESLMTVDSVQKLRDVIGVARALLADLQIAAGQAPYDPETQAGRNAIRAEELLVELNRTLAAAQENLM